MPLFTTIESTNLREEWTCKKDGIMLHTKILYCKIVGILLLHYMNYLVKS